MWLSLCRERFERRRAMCFSLYRDRVSAMACCEVQRLAARLPVSFWKPRAASRSSSARFLVELAESACTAAVDFGAARKVVGHTVRLLRGSEPLSCDFQPGSPSYFYALRSCTLTILRAAAASGHLPER